MEDVMDIAELERRLRQHVDFDVHAEYADFQRLTGGHDVERFLAHLRDRGLISGALLRALHGGERARVSRFHAVPGGSSQVAGRLDDTEREPGVADRVTHLLPRAVQAPAPEPPAQRALTAETGELVAARDYEMLGLVGRGAMGDVFVARDRALLRKVAWKRLSPGLAGKPNMTARFLNEVQVTAQLDHPNVVPIHALEAGSDGVPGYTMKLIQGRRGAAPAPASGGVPQDLRRHVVRAQQERAAPRPQARQHHDWALQRGIRDGLGDLLPPGR
jgi:eukaryotic-like serine/threonine-protein kinase